MLLNIDWGELLIKVFFLIMNLMWPHNLYFHVQLNAFQYGAYRSTHAGQ